jgi:hypothetical protein
MKTNPAIHHGHGVEAFVAQHAADVTGVIRGFDRLRLRGSLRYLYQPSFMKRQLCEARVRLKDFGAYAQRLTGRVREAAHALARRRRRPVRYLHSTSESKEELARRIGERDRVREGLIAVFDCVEPCLTYSCGASGRRTGCTWNCGRAAACTTTSIISTASSA